MPQEGIGNSELGFPTSKLNSLNAPTDTPIGQFHAGCSSVDSPSSQLLLGLCQLDKSYDRVSLFAPERKGV